MIYLSLPDDFGILSMATSPATSISVWKRCQVCRPHQNHPPKLARGQQIGGLTRGRGGQQPLLVEDVTAGGSGNHREPNCCGLAKL